MAWTPKCRWAAARCCRLECRLQCEWKAQWRLAHLQLHMQAAIPNCCEAGPLRATLLPLALQVSLPAWSAVGAAALLAGNTRLLLATALIVSETSGCTPVIWLVIIATALGKAVADAIIPVGPGGLRFTGSACASD